MSPHFPFSFFIYFLMSLFSLFFFSPLFPSPSLSSVFPFFFSPLSLLSFPHHLLISFFFFSPLSSLQLDELFHLVCSKHSLQYFQFLNSSKKLLYFIQNYNIDTNLLCQCKEIENKAEYKIKTYTKFKLLSNLPTMKAAKFYYRGSLLRDKHNTQVLPLLPASYNL